MHPQIARPLRLEDVDNIYLVPYNHSIQAMHPLVTTLLCLQDRRQI
jgi:hypothetical protein